VAAGSVDFGRHRTEQALTAYAEQGRVQMAATRDAAKVAIVREATADMRDRPEEASGIAGGRAGRGTRSFSVQYFLQRLALH